MPSDKTRSGCPVGVEWYTSPGPATRWTFVLFYLFVFRWVNPAASFQ